VVASVRTVSARHADPPDGDRHWPLTSCAHRLRKPHRTDEPLTPAVTRRLRRHGIHPWPRRRRVRLAGPIACLRRRHRTNRSAFRRIGPSLAARVARSRLLLNLRRSRSAPGRLPRSAPAPSRVGWSHQAISSFTGLLRSLACARGSDGTHRTARKMLLSDFCNRPHATSTLTDDSIPEFAPHRDLAAPRGAEVLWRREPLSGQPGWSFA
jgi:hypothetical protein